MNFIVYAFYTQMGAGEQSFKGEGLSVGKVFSAGGNACPDRTQDRLLEWGLRDICYVPINIHHRVKNSDFTLICNHFFRQWNG